jgi:HrpA-like RNA helicase
VTFVHGETGSGKSTQVQQFLLDDPVASESGKIIMALPRRLAVVSLAESIANQRGGEVGEEVGYRIGKEHLDDKDTKLLIVTVGYLLRYLTNNVDAVDDFTHVILDEVRFLSADMLEGVGLCG